MALHHVSGKKTNVTCWKSPDVVISGTSIVLSKLICANKRQLMACLSCFLLLPQPVLTGVTPQSLYFVPKHALMNEYSGVLGRLLLTTKYIGQMQHSILRVSNNTLTPITQSEIYQIYTLYLNTVEPYTRF